MPFRKLQTIWVILLTVLSVVDIFSRAIVKRWLGTINRAWVNKTSHAWARRVIKLIRLQCTVVNPLGVQPKKGQPTIIMCNHTSHFDIPLSFIPFPDQAIRMLSKKELSRIPIMGKGMEAAEFPFIDRKNKWQAIKDLEQVKQLLNSGVVMWIAPEGTRSIDGRLAPFKKGGFITAIDAKATIIPIGIRGAHQILPARTVELNLNQKAEIHVGEPIDASAYTLETKDSLIARVYTAIQQLVEGP